VIFPYVDITCIDRIRVISFSSYTYCFFYDLLWGDLICVVLGKLNLFLRTSFPAHFGQGVPSAVAGDWGAK
jgi:hypothetical protein